VQDSDSCKSREGRRSLMLGLQLSMVYSCSPSYSADRDSVQVGHGDDTVAQCVGPQDKRRLLSGRNGIYLAGSGDELPLSSMVFLLEMWWRKVTRRQVETRPSLRVTSCISYRYSSVRKMLGGRRNPSCIFEHVLSTCDRKMADAGARERWSCLRLR
jgi:hypothetical protein